VTDGSMQASVVVGPPASGEPVQRVELIRGPDAARGQLVGTVDVERQGYSGDMGERTPVTVPAPILPGRRSGGGNQTLVVRAVSRDGKNPGTAASGSVPCLDLPNHYPVVVASIVGDALSGISAPAGTDAWEVDATDGARLRVLPAIEDADPDWGTLEAGLLSEAKLGSYFLTSAVVTCDEYDLGGTYAFVLECYDEAQRKTAAGAFATMTLAEADLYPLWPATSPPELGDQVDGPAWMSRLCTLDGRPVRPLPPMKWEVRWGDASPLSGDWVPYVPGMRIRARYVQARVTLAEPMGLHQVICPRLCVRAWIPMDTRVATKSGGDFGTGELPDVTAVGGPKVVGIRTDTGNEKVQVNAGGSIVTLAPGGSSGPSRVVTWGIFGPIGGGATYFASPACLTMDGMERSWPAPFAATVQKLHVRLDSAPGVDQSVVVTVRKNGADQSLTVTLSDTDQEGSDTANSFPCAAGDLISVSVTGSEFSGADSACVSFVLSPA
jgi:hypothetical protein